MSGAATSLTFSTNSSEAISWLFCANKSSITRSVLLRYIFSPKIIPVFSFILAVLLSFISLASSKSSRFFDFCTRLLFSSGNLSKIFSTSFGKLKTPFKVSLNKRLVIKRAFTISAAANAFGKVSTCFASNSIISPLTSSEITGKKFSNSLMLVSLSFSVISPCTAFGFKPFAKWS